RDRSSAPQPRTEAVVIAVDEDDVPIRRADLAPGGRVFSTWMRLASEGTRPGLVTSRDAANPERLAARGITQVHQAGDADGGSAYSAVSDADALGQAAR